MELNIEIKGKHNINALNKQKGIISKRTETEILDEIDKEYFFNTENHISILSQLYFEQEFKNSQYVIREMNKKINSYKNQDKKKDRLLLDEFITYDELIDKLLKSNLKCYYCKKKVKLLYDDVRDYDQWTLDRIDNDIQHTNENTVICDLKCNLERRRKDDELFMNDKQLKITLLE